MKTLWLWRIRTFPNYLCIALQRPQLGPPVPVGGGGGGGGGGGRWGWLAGSTPKLWWGCSALVLHRLPWIWQKTLNFSTLFMTMYVILHPCIWKTPCLWNKTRIRSSQIIKKRMPCLWQRSWKTIPCPADYPHILDLWGYPPGHWYLRTFSQSETDPWVWLEHADLIIIIIFIYAQLQTSGIIKK